MLMIFLFFAKSSWGKALHRPLGLPLNAQQVIQQGNPKGNIIIVEFADWQCPHCQQQAAILKQLLKTHHDVQLIIVPIVAFGTPSLLKDSFILATKNLPKANKLQTKLWQQPQISFNTLLQQAGLTKQQYQQTIKQQHILKKLKQNRQLLQQLRINKIPLLLIGKQNDKTPRYVYNSTVPFITLNQAINHLNKINRD